MNKALVREIDAMIENHLDAIAKHRKMRKQVLTSYGPKEKPKKSVLPFYAFIEEPILPVYAFTDEPEPVYTRYELINEPPPPYEGETGLEPPGCFTRLFNTIL